jgi:hypothetical protein
MMARHVVDYLASMKNLSKSPGSEVKIMATSRARFFALRQWMTEKWVRRVGQPPFGWLSYRIETKVNVRIMDDYSHLIGE